MNTPPIKRATLKTSESASIHSVLAGSGVLDMSAGGLVIDPRAPARLQISASADRFVHAIGTLLRERSDESGSALSRRPPKPPSPLVDTQSDAIRIGDFEMTSFLNFHAFAATRGDGLRPEFRALFERVAAAPRSELTARNDGMIQSGPDPVSAEVSKERGNVLLFPQASARRTRTLERRLGLFENT